MKKTILITGSAGFVGRHLVDHVLANTDWNIVGFDSFKHRGDSVRVQHDSRYQVHALDLSAPVSDRLLANLGSIDFIVNLASESHVDRSIDDPVPFVQNNVNLVLHMLEAARKLKPRHFVQVSTDEVYGPAAEGTDHAEWSTILPSNPYAASKAAQEAIAISYWRTYGVPVMITNTMNMIGEFQDKEKFVPLIISKVLKGETVPIHGTVDYIGKRKYLHARNMADAILFLLKNTDPLLYADAPDFHVAPMRYNIVGDEEINNLNMAGLIAEIMDLPLKYELVDFHKARPGHDRRYSLDGTLMHDMGWVAPVPLRQSLEKTIQWYLKNPEWLK